MARLTLTPADRDRVTAAVAQAEAGTDGEIVTIVAESSDRYRDVALHWALLAMLLPAALATVTTGWLTIGANAWEAVDPRHLMLVLLAVEVLVFLAVRYAFAWAPLRLALTPKATKRRRVRRRALECFALAAEQRTAAQVGILLYLSSAERMAEIVAERAITARVSPDVWGEAMAALVGEVRQGRTGEGMAAAVARIGLVLAEHFPKTADDINELPDRVIEL